ncbi:MAG: DUF3489 domain-containing protein [Alphaproteobacteria bacterium]|nr:DUF3489 domain-containing protein [Alphaproteobacteria bacterium]
MHQIELSETQTIVLSGACAREDGLVFPVTANIKGGAVGNVLKSLLKRGLIEEISANDPDTVWRHDEDIGSITLRATPLAYSVLGQPEETLAPEIGHSAPPATMVQRRSSKQVMLIEMLEAPDGATIAQIVEAIGWQQHTVRGAISGALKKKLGLNVVSEKIDGRGRVYRIE